LLGIDCRVWWSLRTRSSFISMKLSDLHKNRLWLLISWKTSLW
jgi:hypothetical protein